MLFQELTVRKELMAIGSKIGQGFSSLGNGGFVLRQLFYWIYFRQWICFLV